MRSSWFISCLLLGTGVLGRAVDLGSIHVTVLDAQQKPVRNAQVEMHQEWNAAGFFPCWTDEHGTCTLGPVAMGQYEVYISNYKEGYPRPSSFYFGRDFKRTTVTLQKDARSQNVVLHVGSRMGFLKLIVTDELSGSEIMPVDFRISWVSDPDNATSTGRGDDLVVLVPGDVPLSLIASSDGYEDWQYTSTDGAAVHSLIVHPGEHRTLSIRLHPKHP